MGGAVSSGRDNSELIDNLVSSNYIRSRDVERVFRALDRADYMTRDARDQAYKDLAWRHGPLHLSAPCIYSEVMEGLELHPGLSFLNVGSGTGYLSTLVGLILGSAGISHGIEVNPSVFEYATKRLSQFIENSPVLDEFDFCEPKYFCAGGKPVLKVLQRLFNSVILESTTPESWKRSVVTLFFKKGNGLCIAPLGAPYDRVYCGAGCPEEYQNYFKQLIKVGGILVMPLNDNLVQVKRVGETEWTSQSVLNVSFATLREPTKEESADLIRIEELCPPRLQLLCRGVVRAQLRGGVWRRHPELRAPPRPPPAKKPCPRRICIPIEDESDVEGLNGLHDLDRGGGAGEMNALLSLVLSMGPNRVAGALRFDAPDDDDTLSDDDNPPPEAGEASGSRSNSQEGTDSSRGSWAARPCRGMLTFELRDQPRDAAAPEPVPSASGTQPTTTENEEKPTETREAEAADTEKVDTGTEQNAAAADATDNLDKDADTSNRGDAAVDSRDRSDEDRNDRYRRDRRDRDSVDKDNARDRSNTRDSSTRNRRRPYWRRDGRSDDDDYEDMPAEVEIYLGKMDGGEASSIRQDMDCDADEEEEDDDDDDDDDDEDEEEEDTETEAGLEPDTDSAAPSAPSDTASAADKPPRQKLDSGIGELTPSVESSPASGYEAGSSRRSGPDSDRADSRPGERRRRRQRYVPRRGSESGSSGASGASGTSGTSGTSGDPGARRRPKRRASDGGDARRVRLSILMKRSVKELPLPYALKKYVNLGRCFEF